MLEWEEYFEPHILERGRSYARRGAVKYISRHEDVSIDEVVFLYNFSYATRYSAREFCRHLVRFSPNFNESPLSKDIIDQEWMPIDWQHDPTIRSMLQMIDDIHEKFNDVFGLWEKLKEGVVSFYFLPIKDMGLTDELYIKMNSRGKALTEFEHFKAEWERRIQELDAEVKNRISRKIDTEWTDVFWPFHEGNGIIDSKFMRYFRFLCDVIRFKQGLLRGDEDIFDLAAQMFGPTNPDALKNILLLGCLLQIIKKLVYLLIKRLKIIIYIHLVRLLKLIMNKI